MDSFMWCTWKNPLREKKKIQITNWKRVGSITHVSKKKYEKSKGQNFGYLQVKVYFDLS